MNMLMVVWNLVLSLIVIRRFIMSKSPHIKTYYLDFGKYNIQLWVVESRFSDGSIGAARGVLKIGFGGWQ